MRGEGSLDSRFVHLDTSYQHQDTEDTGRLDTRYRWLEWRDAWPGYGRVIVGLVSIGKWISSARLGAAAGAGEHSGSAIYIQTMYTSHHTPDCSNIQHCTLPSSIQLQLHTDGVWFDEVWFLDFSDRLSMKIFANKHPNCRKRKLFECLL